MIRKNATLTSVIFSLIIVFGFFIGMYLYLSYNITESGSFLNSTYNDTYTNLIAKQNELNDLTTDLRSAVGNVTEPSSIYSVAFFGLKAFLDVVKLPLKVVDIAGSTYLSANTLVETPSWFKALTIISITIFIILIVIAIIKGEQKI
jgi:hypothetical protein